MSDTAASVALVALVVVALVIYASSRAQAAPTYQPSPATPIAPPEPDMPTKCGYWIQPSAVTGVTSAQYVCCHPRNPDGSSTGAGGAVGSTVGKFIPVPILGPLVGSIFGQGIGAFFSKGNCADTDADRAAAVAAGWGT